MAESWGFDVALYYKHNAVQIEFFKKLIFLFLNYINMLMLKLFF
jgi:hypothetical protein